MKVKSAKAMTLINKNYANRHPIIHEDVNICPWMLSPCQTFTFFGHRGGKIKVPVNKICPDMSNLVFSGSKQSTYAQSQGGKPFNHKAPGNTAAVIPITSHHLPRRIHKTRHRILSAISLDQRANRTPPFFGGRWQSG